MMFQKPLKRIIQLNGRNISHSNVLAFTTYSGGHAHQGQGGFYGSIKSRSETHQFRPGSRAEVSDIDTLNSLMSASNHNESSESNLKELAKISSHASLLNRLVIKGAPVWGLTVEQRDFVNRMYVASKENRDT
uniref:Uncharacterized protein AlNc14C305G10440 n=1 Tax=Albugo laibachii Nc14 TaxID=890382 RepID=F0WVX9_9STRA|nr:conserved hypothetical protein [Albugo laibachii Nc14]|eukprot:CCA25580.1 conserved hypothetical protein [Albugo laibachii Nc14]